jgi:hypothetical protein
LDGLQGEARAREIANWYDRESQLLQQKSKDVAAEKAAAHTQELELLELQRDVLLEQDGLG